jgi:FtsH-binding integral membrane protein
LYPLGAIWLGNVGLGFYSMYKMGKINSITNSDMTEEIPAEKKMYYKIFSVSNGITITPIVLTSYAIDPMIFPIALTSTIATFGGATYYALKQTNLNAITWQAPLMGCVVGLIGTNLMTLIASYCGFTNFANTLDLGATVVSTVVFTGLIVADTQLAISNYKEKALDTIKTSTELLLNATNLFIDIIKLLIKLKKDQ